MVYFLEVVRQRLHLFSETNTSGFGGGDTLRLTLVAFHFAFLLCHLGEEVRHKQS